MQIDQALHDRKTKAGSTLASIIRIAGLKIRLSDAEQILVIDADAVVLDRKRHRRRIGPRTERNRAAALGEADGVGYEIDQDLIERAFVGNDLRQIGARNPFQPDARLARPQRQQLATSGDDV